MRDLLSLAVGPVLESLENRRLFHTPFYALVDFRPAGTTAAQGDYVDNGQTYGDRGNGLDYGWNADNTANACIRNSSLSPDARYDNFEHMQKGGDFTWEIGVENGDYSVRVVAGDADYTDSIYKINAEGLLAVSGAPTSANHWVEGTKIVSVADGKLTISNADGSSNNRICFVEISSYHAVPTVGIHATQSDIFEVASNGSLTVSRTGSLSNPLTVSYSVGGSATPGVDYDALSGSVLIPTGEDHAIIDIVPHPGAGADGDKTVMLTLTGTDWINQIDEGSGSATLRLQSVNGSLTSRRVNFQPSGSAVPDFYKSDTGAAYGARPNGLTYGWNGNNTGTTRDRNSSTSPDQRYDTFIHMQKGGDFKWEMAVSNGTYTVRVVSGDATAIDSVFKIDVEGVLTVSGTPTSSNHWVEGTKTVTVKDGKLTISNASGAKNNKIAFIEIMAGSQPLPVVKFAPADSSAKESGDKGMFAVSRTGDLSKSLTVNYTISGSATNGSDYTMLTGAVAIPAGASQATISVMPIQDSIAEGTESVSLTLSDASSYSLGSKFNASVSIADDDVNNSTSLGSLSWSTKASSPQKRAEATGVSIGGKLYAFGGYQDTTYHPIARVDRYDPKTNTWTRMNDMPGALTHAGTTTDGTFAYLAGGYPGDPNKGQVFSTTNVWKYDPGQDKWTSLKPLPVARGAGNLQYLNSKLYFFGGSDSDRKDRAEMYSLDLTQSGANWVQLASMHAARNHVGGAALNGMIYAIGGQQLQDQNSDFKGDVWRYDPGANKWTTVASLINQPRSHINGATVVYHGHIIAMGGEGPGRVALRNVESYDPVTNKWTSLAPLPSGRSSGIGVIIDDQLVFNGGYSGQFNTQTWVGTFS